MYRLDQAAVGGMFRLPLPRVDPSLRIGPGIPPSFDRCVCIVTWSSCFLLLALAACLYAAGERVYGGGLGRSPFGLLQQAVISLNYLDYAVDCTIKAR